MQLVNMKTKQPVNVGDILTHPRDNEKMVVTYFIPPHKPSSNGFISVRPVDKPEAMEQEYYVMVFGLKWEDKDE